MLDDLSLTAHDLYMREMRQTPQLTSDEEAQLLLDLASDRDVRQVRERLGINRS